MNNADHAENADAKTNMNTNKVIDTLYMMLTMLKVLMLKQI